MNPKHDSFVYSGNDHFDMKEVLEVTQNLIPTQRKELNSDEVKNLLRAKICCKNKIYVQNDTDYLESTLFIKKELTYAKDYLVAQNLNESQAKVMEVDQTKIKQESLKIDTDSKRIPLIKGEIYDHENLKDMMFNQVECIKQKKYTVPNYTILSDLLNEKIPDKKTVLTHCIGHLETSENGEVTDSAEVDNTIKNHSCEICEKTFSQRFLLKRHITSVHNKLKEHLCQI